MKKFDFSDAIEQLYSCKTAEKSIGICGHVNPDGDSLGSVLALSIALKTSGFKVYSLLADAKLPRVYDFLPCYDTLLHSRKYPKACDIFISVDVPTQNRLGNAQTLLAGAKIKIAIDHHEGNVEFADISYVDSNAPSCSMIIWDFIAALDVSYTSEIAICALCGLITDTGRFQYQNAGKDAFEYATKMCAEGANAADICANVYQRNTAASLALQALVVERMQLLCENRAVLSWVCAKDLKKLNATKDDTDMLINVLRSLDGVEVAVVLREENKHMVHGSIRSKTKRDVSLIANALGGGGHMAAAGFTCELGVEAVIEKVRILLEKEFASEACS